MSNRPTEAAAVKFAQARREAIDAGFAVANGKPEMHMVHMANAAQLSAEGMNHLVVGLRAVYILLEQVQKRQEHGR